MGTPPQPRPGMPHQQRPGFPTGPQGQISQPPVPLPNGAQPMPLMPPSAQRPYSAGAQSAPGALNQQFGVGRPMMNMAQMTMPPQQQFGVATGPMTAADMQAQQTSPTSPVDGTEHSSRRRPAYPKTISTAYSGGGDVDPFGGGTYNGPAETVSNVQQDTQNTQQYFTPGFGSGAANQQQPPPGYPQQQGTYGTNAMVGQFGNMSVNPPGSGPSRQLNQVSLMGVPPNVEDFDAAPPPIMLDPSCSVTRSPYSNCDPSYKRCTMNAIPQTPGLLSKSRLPFGLIITPFKCLKEGEMPVPLVTDNTITRCRRCRTYINPYVQFVEGGNRWKCNLCYLLNDVPSSFDIDPMTGQPVDRWQRHELNHAVVEFVAPAEYMVRPPQPLVYLFVIDVSYVAVQSGMVATAAKTILDSLDRIPNDGDRTKVGFITVDSVLHFYSLGPEQADPQMLVVSDLDDVYLPQPEDLLCNLAESRGVVESLLGRLSEMFKDTKNVGSALGPALQAAIKLIAPTGGRVVVLQSALPNCGVGALKPREDPKVLGTAKESAYLLPASPFYKNLAVDCSRTQTTIDMFLFGAQYTDVATLCCAPRYTGGTTFFYPGFNAGMTEDAMKFAQELADHLSAPIGLEAVMRVRASKGLRMSSYHGNFFVRSTDLLALPSVTPGHSYAIEMVIEENVSNAVVSFQTALLHTTCYGERRIRVLTLALPVTSTMSDLYASVDQFAVSGLLARKAVEKALTTKLEDARDALTNKMIDILGVYKTSLTAAASGATSQLAICDNLKLLPLLVLGLIKHVAFQNSPRIPSDLRSYAMSLLSIMPVESVVPYIHPRFYALHRLPPDVGSAREDGRITMPPTLNLSSERLERYGVYLLETGETSFFWVGKETHPQLCMDLFDAPNVESLRSGKFILPNLDTDVSVATHLILSYTRASRKATLAPYTYLIKEDGDPTLRVWFLAHLVEDRTGNDHSYHQYLGHLKEKVNNGSF